METCLKLVQNHFRSLYFTRNQGSMDEWGTTLSTNNDFLEVNVSRHTAQHTFNVIAATFQLNTEWQVARRLLLSIWSECVYPFIDRSTLFISAFTSSTDVSSIEFHLPTSSTHHRISDPNQTSLRSARIRGKIIRTVLCCAWLSFAKTLSFKLTFLTESW